MAVGPLGRLAALAGRVLVGCVAPGGIPSVVWCAMWCTSISFPCKRL